MCTEITALLHSTFAHCVALNSIWLPPRLTQIGKEVFLNCVALQEVVIPTELSDIGIRAFCGCEQLQRFTQNAPSGSARGLLVWSMTKVMDVSVRQLSNAHLPSCAPGVLVFLSPHHIVFLSLSMMTWALRPHGVRTRGKKHTLPHAPLVAHPRRKPLSAALSSTLQLSQNKLHTLIPFRAGGAKTERPVGVCRWEQTVWIANALRQLFRNEGHRVTRGCHCREVNHRSIHGRDLF